MNTIRPDNTFKHDDFSPLEKTQTPQFGLAASLSYWQQVWRKLRANYRAMASLYLIVGLMVFSGIGPLIWRLDPAAQDLSQISQAPALSKTAVLFDAQKSVSPSDIPMKVSQLHIAGLAHTEVVKLLWPAVPHAAYYQIFRHEHAPRGAHDLGLPLDDTGRLYFEDKLSLEPIAYYYSVAAMQHDGSIASYETVKVEPVIAVRKNVAQQKIAEGVWQTLPSIEVDGHELERVKLSAHPMGTDYLGRDMMSRLMHGGRTSLLIALMASLLFVAFGSVYGAASAYLGGKVDNVLMRFADFVIALPFLLFMILLKVGSGLGPGESGISVMIVSLIILSWPSSARLIRAQALVLREQNFVLAAKISGASTTYILAKHFTPNVLSLVLVSLSFAIPSVMLTEAFLSFIGLGVVPPTPSWGAMCQEGIKSFLFHPHELIFPASFIGLTVLAFNLLGDGLRDALDVKVA